MILKILFRICLFALLTVVQLSAAKVDDLDIYPGMGSSEILKLRNYETKNFYLVTPDKYKLHIVRGRNPLIKKRADKGVPILFLHGVLCESNSFVVNSHNVKPRDFTHLSLYNESDYKKILNDPSANSLPFLAMNFGHEVWLLDRRGAPRSQGRWKKKRDRAWRKMELKMSNSTKVDEKILRKLSQGTLSEALHVLIDELQLLPVTFESDFWDFSLDEQAEIDLPLVVEYISQQNDNSKVAIVGHSAGGAITLMSLAAQPEIADLVSGAVLWSSAFTLGNADIFNVLRKFTSLFESLQGSLPPAFSTIRLQTLFGVFCRTNLARTTLCDAISDLVIGDSDGKASLRPQFINSVFFPTATHELAQLLQCGFFKGEMHKYNYNSEKVNQAKYNQTKPPAYDLSRIKLDKISFYAAGTDAVVSKDDIKNCAEMMNVPYQLNLIDTTFNHQGYFYHDDTASLAIIPSMKDIQRFGYASP